MIIEVHSKSTVCAAIKQQIGPVVAGLLQNNQTIVHGLISMDEMVQDSGRYWMEIDKLHLENDVSKIVRNLQATHDLLDRPDPSGTSPADAAKIAEMRAQLRIVAGAQLATLNSLDGALETQQMNQIMGSNGVPNINSGGISEVASAYDAATSQQDTAVSSQSRKHTQAGKAENPLLQNALEAFPAMRRAEAQAAQVIVPIAQSCDRLDAPPKLGP